MIEAEKNLEKIIKAKDNLTLLAKNVIDSDADAVAVARINLLRAEFFEAMDDDFNTALAFSVMYALIKEINHCLQEQRSDNVISKKLFGAINELFSDITAIFGILEQKTEIDSNGNYELVAKLMDLVISLRQDARTKKDWAASDTIRNQLAAIGIIIEDGKDGVKWKLK